MRHIMASACGLLLLTVATPANACSPPQTREWTRAEVIEAARLDHAKAQFVADVHVLGWTGEGRLVLGVERQFKGTKRASLVLVPSGCGDLIPPVGRRARLLVRSLDGAKGADLQAWGAPEVLDDDDIRLFEREIDRLIGRPRPPGTFSQLETRPPLPPQVGR